MFNVIRSTFHVIRYTKFPYLRGVEVLYILTQSDLNEANKRLTS